MPIFGNATLNNCELEQIHLAGSIQPHGALLVLQEPDLLVLQASVNVGAFLADDSLPWVGRGLDALSPALATSIRHHVGDSLGSVPLALRVHAEADRPLDLLLHRPASGGLVVEIEDAGPPLDLSGPISTVLKGIVASASLQSLCDETAWQLRELTGYDRVMVYQFDEEGHGAVIAEQRRLDLEAFLGNRYPSTDIPQIARRLYERNRVRVLVDVAYTPVPIMPPRAATTGLELDMSLCVLRSSSPIHVQYLKNMGVCATLVISLVVGDRLWGLISCHHYSPRQMHFETRAVCEFLAEAVATRIAALESFVQSQVELSVRRIEQRIIEAIGRDGDWRVALFDGSRSLLAPLAASGAALLFEGESLTIGDVPSTQKIREIGQFLDERVQFGALRGRAFATTALGVDAPRFVSISDVASGLLAATVSSSPGEYLLWFRPEQIQTVIWGGNPEKPTVAGGEPGDLSPRRSFAQWQQVVEGMSVAWTPAEQTAGRLIGETITDVVLQFRAVRTLIAQDLLEQVSRQVDESEQAVIIADDAGRITVINEAFCQLFPTGCADITSLQGLPALFQNAADIKQRLDDLCGSQRMWRGEVLMKVADGGVLSMLVRADPVFSSPDRVLGYVLLFTDLTERKRAEQARRLFQKGVEQAQRTVSTCFGSATDLAAQSLLSTVLENAQLAAMEITEGVDTAGMARQLDSVRTSVQRASDILGRLILHAGRPD